MPAPTFAQELSIDQAIARLINVNDDDRLSFLEALFKFITWLRWPTQIGDHPAAISVCVIAYLAGKKNAATIDQLDPADIVLLHRHLRLDTLKNIFSDAVLAMPSFVPWTLVGQRYDRSDFLADITWFLLAYEPQFDSRRDRVSLFKAYNATQQGVFRNTWWCSHRTFRTIWLTYGPAAPFHYVERFHPSVEFTLDPSSSDFTQSVDEIVGRRNDLLVYFARCRAAIELMVRRLDRRAVLALRLPRFPVSLGVDSITPPPLPPDTNAIIKGLRREDKC